MNSIGKVFCTNWIRLLTSLKNTALIKNRRIERILGPTLVNKFIQDGCEDNAFHNSVGDIGTMN